MQEVIQESMESYNEYIRNVIPGTVSIANKLRMDEAKEALSMISDFTEGVIWMSDINEKLKGLGYSVELNINDIQEYLEEINEGLQNQDFILVADMFEYEISTFFEQLELYEVK
ncbi:hypothetical protein MKY88_03435 [Lysinibacillus sp. FSL R7-0073]|uniref:hypothetical protein n=1 Tax=Lysinibacillus TaxID=400634 RepID=UPI002E1D2F42|nr:hypothetical protein [Lysinibacillus fusiformis]